MRKFLFLIIVIGLLSGCSSKAYKEFNEENPDAELGDYGSFKIVDTASISTLYQESYVNIVQDTTTGCMYIADAHSSAALSISPLYDDAGQVKGCGQ